MYDGSTKPEDWLESYLLAVDIAGGNQRWAVRYVPQMLEGLARIWLNNLPENSIECWIDFYDAFVSNFTRTYKRPNRPQQLAVCRQRENETDREYLTRWSQMRNSCEGVVEAQAISWFAQWCRHGSMLWQRLQREMPTTLAETIKIVDMYALGDLLQPALQPAEPSSSRPNMASGSYQRPVQDFRKRNMPDYWYSPNQVAAMEQNQGVVQCPRIDGSKQWPPRNDYPRKQFDGQKKWQSREKFT